MNVPACPCYVQVTWCIEVIQTAEWLISACSPIIPIILCECEYGSETVETGYWLKIDITWRGCELSTSVTVTCLLSHTALFLSVPIHAQCSHALYYTEQSVVLLYLMEFPRWPQWEREKSVSDLLDTSWRAFYFNSEWIKFVNRLELVSQSIVFHIL